MQFAVAGDAVRGPSVVNEPDLPPRIDEKGKKKSPGPAAGVVAAADPIPLARVTPSAPLARAGGSGLAALGDRTGGQGLIEIPKIYQPRLEPDRSVAGPADRCERRQRAGRRARARLAGSPPRR